MCRFALYLGPTLGLDSLVTLPVNSIIHQSFHSHERTEPLNGDGFGVGWYAPELSEEPALFRSVSPAWNNQNLKHLARVTRSGCVLAHVRAASPGSIVSEANCHPFAHGRFAFMHNGSVGGFAALRRALLAELSDEAFALVRGSTDSEHLFALFVDEHAKAAGVAERAERMAAALEASVARLLALAEARSVKEPHHLNLAVTDGSAAAVTRFTTASDLEPGSLYWHQGMRYLCVGNACRMVAPDAHGGAVLVCSEPLSADPGWHRVPRNHVVLVREDRTVEVREMGVGGRPTETSA